MAFSAAALVPLKPQASRNNRRLTPRVPETNAAAESGIQLCNEGLNFMTDATGFTSLWRVASIVGLGFLPVAEGNVAVPVALALGFNPVSAVVLSVFGTTTQTLLTRGLAGRLLSYPPVAGWWERCLTGRIGRLFAWKGVVWVILVGIPWLGGVPTALGARLSGMSTARYAGWAISGLFLHAGILALLIRLGLHAAGKG